MMKFGQLTAALLAGALAGCGSPAISDYTTSRDSLFYLQQIKPAKVSVGEFTDLTEFNWHGTRLDIGCSLPDVAGDASDFDATAYVRNAFVAELMASGSLSPDPIEPQIRAELTRLSFGKGLLFDGVWTAEILLKSSNGNQLLTSAQYGFDTGALLGPTICHRAAENFEPAVRMLLEKAIQSPEFPALMQGS